MSATLATGLAFAFAFACIAALSALVFVLSKRRRPTMVLWIGKHEIVITDKTTAEDLARQIRKAIQHVNERAK